MIEWLTGTVAGKFISTFFISMVPVVELRAGLPYGIALGLDYCGVDLLETDEGPVLCEVNSNAFFEGFDILLKYH